MAATVQENSHTITVFDATRRITAATARKVRGGWILKANGFCWTDPAARRPNVVGGVEPSLMIVQSKAQARRILSRLACDI